MITSNFPDRKLFRLIITVFTLIVMSLPVVGSALEIKNDDSSPIVDQITAKVLSEIEAAMRVKASEVPAIALRIASPVDVGKTRERLISIAEHVRLLEGENAKKMELKLAVEPMLLKTSNDIEITVIAFFSVSGLKIRSGIMTLQIIQPATEQDLIKCEVRLGHITFSTSPLVE